MVYWLLGITIVTSVCRFHIWNINNLFVINSFILSPRNGWVITVTPKSRFLRATFIIMSLQMRNGTKINNKEDWVGTVLAPPLHLSLQSTSQFFLTKLSVITSMRERELVGGSSWVRRTHVVIRIIVKRKCR